MKLQVFTILLFLKTLTQAQSTICIPIGSSVNIDGVISNNEWQDADSLLIGTSNQTKVLYKHDGSNFLAAFLGNLQSSSSYPEILIDIDNDKSPSWLADDWWFHVSAQDCEYLGQYGNYDSCSIVRPNWTAVRNMGFGPPIPPYIDTIEVEIPFSTLNINLSSSDTIGISFLVTNTFNLWTHWPSSANRNIPSTWSSAFFASRLSSVDNHGPVNTKYFTLYPNPIHDILHIKSNNMISPKHLEIRTIDGKLVLKQKFSRSVNIEHLEKGIYILNLIANRTYPIKFVKK